MEGRCIELHTFIRKAVVSPRKLATASKRPRSKDLEPNLSSSVPSQDRLAGRDFGHVHLVGSLVPWLLVIVNGHLPPRGDGENVCGAAAGLVAAHIGAVYVCNRAIVLRILRPSAGAPLGTRDANVGEVV